MKRYNLILLAIVVLFGACTTSSDETGLEDIPIVQAYLYPSDTFKVEISKLTPYADEEFTDEVQIEDLAVYASDGVQTIALTSRSNGIFIDENHSIDLHDSTTYTLQFIYGDMDVKGQTIIPTKPTGITQSETQIDALDFGNMTPGEMPEPLEISWDNYDASYYLVVVENTETDPVAVNDDEDKERMREFRSQPGQIEEFRIMPMTFEYYGKYRIIIFHLNEDYAALYEEQSTNSLNINRPSSSITNALGVFTGVNSDTIFVDVE